MGSSLITACNERLVCSKTLVVMNMRQESAVALRKVTVMSQNNCLRNVATRCCAILYRGNMRSCKQFSQDVADKDAT